MLESTEESKKVSRLGGKKYFAVYERLPDWNNNNNNDNIDRIMNNIVKQSDIFQSHVMKLFV